MAIMVEREEKPELRIQKAPEEIKLPEHLKKDGIEAVETAFRANVKDGQGQTLTQTPANQQVSIAIPANQITLKKLARGSVTNAVTWMAAFWLRMIKKAMHFGWKIVGGHNAS